MSEKTRTNNRFSLSAPSLPEEYLSVDEGDEVEINGTRYTVENVTHVTQRLYLTNESGETYMLSKPQSDPILWNGETKETVTDWNPTP